jgi:hypothetical protein
VRRIAVANIKRVILMASQIVPVTNEYKPEYFRMEIDRSGGNEFTSKEQVDMVHPQRR